MLFYTLLYNMTRRLTSFIATIALSFWSLAMCAQDAEPVISFYSVDDEEEVEITPGESQVAQAPLDITLTANVDCPDGYDYVSEWRLWRTDESEDKPLITRFEDETNYTLTESGGYSAKLYVSFTQEGDTIDYESEVFSIVISESKLTAPDGFSPNNDGINDFYRITAQSIVKFEAQFFNRWGQCLHSVSLRDVQHAEGEPEKWVLWDGKVNGNYVKDGVYFVNIDARGSDGIHYKIKKAVNVLKGFKENGESSGI